MAGHKPVCVKCGLFFKPKKNGVAWEEGKPVGPLHNGKPVNGTWDSYKIWLADLWECRGCDTEIIVGSGFTPVSEHYQPDYAQVKEDLKPMVFVEDC